MLSLAQLISLAPRLRAGPAAKAAHVETLALAKSALFDAQIYFDKLLHAMPDWLPFVLFALAAALLVLGRHGQRLLAGALCSSGVAAVALLWLSPRMPNSPLPGVLLIIGSAFALAAGMAWPSLGTAVASAGLCGLSGAAAASHLGSSVPSFLLTIAFALLGFFLALANDQRLSLLLPPTFAALFLALGLSRKLGPHFAGAQIPQLAELPWAAAVFACSALFFLCIALARDEVGKRRLAARTLVRKDAAAKQLLEKRQKTFKAYLGPTGPTAPEGATGPARRKP